ncbi:hypothetical protein [Histophilus somni]|uniref:hypothetical protein n=1 Tax=Histophilus somni TaxID=731 RepID=UPI0018EAC45C|nr:hypothetical protein [Histophilus somni]QQF66343.1 hypothetical protein JFL60_03540 [Histophilus somni]QQF79404.1 hypothetical protein JFL53_03600 [Histophilus somni]QQF84822.1 hypothetical protein JFL54_03550 [Histophilus somni]
MKKQLNVIIYKGLFNEFERVGKNGKSDLVPVVGLEKSNLTLLFTKVYLMNLKEWERMENRIWCQWSDSNRHAFKGGGF